MSVKIGSYTPAVPGRKEIIDRGCSSQGMIFKDSAAYAKSLDQVCYIPELTDSKYTHQDFLDLCNGQEEFASILFNDVDWQHPETALDENIINGEWIQCDHCQTLFDYEIRNTHQCPNCHQFT